MAIGPYRIGVLLQISKLPNKTIIRGNTKRYVATNDPPGAIIDDGQANLELLKPPVQATNIFAWTQDMAAAYFLLPLAKLALNFETISTNDTTVLRVNASSGTDDGMGTCPACKNEEIENLFNGCHGDSICEGHTHLPLEKKWNEMHLMNPRYDGICRKPDLHNCYAKLETDEKSYRINHSTEQYHCPLIQRRIPHQLLHRNILVISDLMI